MKFNSSASLNFDTISKFAGDIARRKQPKASKILDFLIDRPERDYINLCFAYLRWADDIIDDPDIPLNDKKEFIEHQKNLISLIYMKKNFESSVIEEACLSYFAEYALSSGNLLLIDEVRNMIDALSMDVERLERNGVFSSSELEHYIDLMSKSFFNILCIFSLPKEIYREEFYLGTKFTTIALMIKDFEEDINAGFINIPAEDIEHFKIDIKNIRNDKNLSLCLAGRIKLIFELLYKEVDLLKYLPFKFRIFTCYTLVYRMIWVIRAKVYGYKLTYISNRTFSGELRTYLLSFFLSLNILIKGFILVSKK